MANTLKLAEMGSDELAKRKAAIDAQIAALLEQQTEMALFVAEQQEQQRKAAIDSFIAGITDGIKNAIKALPGVPVETLESLGGSVALTIRLGNHAVLPTDENPEGVLAEDPIVVEQGVAPKRTRIASTGSGASDGTKERRDLKGFREYLAKSDPSRWASFTADYKVRLAKRLRDNPGTTESSSKNSIENFLSLKYLELVSPHVKSMFVKIVAADAPDDVSDDTASDTGAAEQPEGSNAEAAPTTA